MTVTVNKYVYQDVVKIQSKLGIFKEQSKLIFKSGLSHVVYTENIDEITE